MITEAVKTIADYVAGLGLEAAKDRFKKKLDENRIRAALSEYVERQRKYNLLCSLAEEIDFQGLIEYISDNLLDVVNVRLFDPNKKKRVQARDEAISAAIAYSEASTEQAKYRISTCISICLDIIRNFYKTGISIKDYILASEIVDAVADSLKEETETVTTAIDGSEKTLSAQLDDVKKEIISRITSGGALFSVDRMDQLSEAGDYDAIEGAFNKVLGRISLSHPLFPYYGFEHIGGKIRSKPLIPEAKKKYPPKFLLTGTIRFGDQYYNDQEGNPADYSYRNQLPIIMEVKKAIKLLGERPDPRQDEVEKIVGNTVVLTPPEFPSAFPCAIKVRDKTYFEYVLMRTQKILDDGTYVIGNKEQGGSIYFEVKINPENPSSPFFTININGGNNRERLNYVRFMNALSIEKDLHIYVLSAGEDIIAGYINDFNYQTGFSSVEEEIDFIERVCTIEDYFGVSLNPTEGISQQEYEATIHISDLIRNDEVKGTWSEATFTGIIDQNFRDKLASLDKDSYTFSFVGTSHVDLFGAEFEFRFMRTFKCAQMVEYERVKRKVDVLDDGDNIKITFKAGEDNSSIDTLQIPEKIDGATETKHCSEGNNDDA